MTRQFSARSKIAGNHAAACNICSILIGYAWHRPCAAGVRDSSHKPTIRMKGWQTNSSVVITSEVG